MIIYHARRLHVRVADRGSDELEAASFQILGQSVGFQRSRLHGLSGHALGIAQSPVACEAPDVPIKAAELLLYFQETARIGDGAFDLQAIPDDARVVHQARDVGLSESRHLARLEVLERLPEVLALAQDRNPAQPRLKALQDQHLEHLPIIMDRHAPLLVVIRTVERILPTPPAPGLTFHRFSCLPARLLSLPMRWLELAS